MSLLGVLRTSARVEFLFPFLSWAPMVNRRTLAADLTAGLTGAIIVLPQGVAFAAIAGMPPEYGLYAAITPTIVAALFGSSWHLVAGPSTTASLVLAGALGAFAEPGTASYVKLAITLAFMVGILELALGLFRLGALVNFISHSVIVGFTAGVGVIIIITQFRHVAGLAVPNGLPVHAVATHILTHFRDIDPAAMLVGLITLATGAGVTRYLPRIPPLLAAIVAGSLAGAALDRAGVPVATIGALPSHLPYLSAPSFDPAVWSMLAPTALALAISALNESVSISRALAIRSGQHVAANQEFIGQGMANMLGSFFSGYVVSSSFNRSALNYAAGAKTPVSALIAGLSLIVLIEVAAPLAAWLPHAAMGASLLHIGWGLIDRQNIRQIVRTSRTEGGILVATFLSALFMPVQAAILAGVALSLVVYLYRTSNPRIMHLAPDPASPGRKMTESRPDLPECPQFHIIRFNGSLFFGAVNSFKEELVACEKAAPQCRHAAIIMGGVNFIDVAGAEALAQMARRRREQGGGLYLIGPNPFVLRVLERGGYLEAIDARRVFASKTNALRAICGQLDREICRRCRLRVFVECARLSGQETQAEDSAAGVT